MDKRTENCQMRLPPKLKEMIQSLADNDIRNLQQEIIVLLSEAIFFRVNGIRLAPEFFHRNDYTEQWQMEQRKQSKTMSIEELERIKFELEDPK